MFLAVVFLLSLLRPIGTAEPTPTLTHQPVDCIIVGKFAVIPACFEPARQMARGRVYFQVEDSTSWFYVDVKSAQAACWSGVLPKPSQALLNRHVRYYVEVMTPSMDATRTPDHAALVVRSAEECHAPVVAAVSSTTCHSRPGSGQVGTPSKITTVAPDASGPYTMYEWPVIQPMSAVAKWTSSGRASKMRL